MIYFFCVKVFCVISTMTGNLPQGSPVTKQVGQFPNTGRYRCEEQERDMPKLRKGTDVILHVI